MIPLPLALGVIGLALMVVMGAALGLLISVMGKMAFRIQQATYIIDSIVGAIAFPLGFWITAVAANYEIEVNGRVLGWSQGGDWLGLRWWVINHTLTTQALVACLLISFVWTARAHPSSILRVR